MEGKIILLVLVGILISVGSTSLVSAAPPNTDGDGDGKKEGAVNEIVDTLNHEVYGLEEIKREVRHIEDAVFDPVFGLEAIHKIVKHIEDAVFNFDFGLEVIDDEVEHIEIELHDSDYGLDAIDNEVEHIEGAVFDPNFGLEEIKREVKIIEDTVLDGKFGLEEIEIEINDEHDDRQDEHMDIQEVVDAIGGTGIKPYKVQIDMRFNQYDGASLVAADSLANRFGVIAHCPSEDPNCGQFTFASVKNLNGFEYTYPNKNGNSHEESKDVCGFAGCVTDVNVGFLNSARTLTHFDLDDSGNIITSEQSIFDIPIPVLIGTEANILETSGLGTQHGQKIVFTTNPLPYTGVMEFLIYAPEGSTFTHIWGCDNLGLDPGNKDSIDDIVELAAADPGLALATFAGIATAEVQHNCDWESDSPKSVNEYSPTKFPAP